MKAHKRNIYLDILPLSKAYTIIEELPIQTLSSYLLPTHESVGHVLSESIYARVSSPNYHSAAMDGIAVRAYDTYTAREDNPLSLEEGIDFIYINTGNPLPDEYDAVIMIEHVIRDGDTHVVIESPAYKWQHVRKIGEDIIATQMILPQYHTISARDIGYILTAGIFDVPVYQEARVCIIPTGDELLSVEDRILPTKGEVIESNSYVLKALLKPFTQAVTIVPRIQDTQEAITQALEKAIEDKYHCILLCAGSSAGSKDFARSAIENVGKVLFHGIKAMPGKPTMLGLAGTVPIVGVPGYPGSTSICFEKIIALLLHKITHKAIPPKERVQGYLVQDTPSKLGIEEFIKVCIGNINGTYVAIPLPKATGSTRTLSLAEGICTIPAHKEGISTNEKIDIEIYIPTSHIDNTIICIGSHDDSLDGIDAFLGVSSPYRLRTVHTGSMGGIYALKNRTTHCAGMHLLDKEHQDFTIPYLQKYLPHDSFVLYTIAMRAQCLYVQKGNPKGIHSLQDIVTKRATFINRQHGSGTRLLLDSMLAQENISPADIVGYATEEYSHLATALHVATGNADCALGIYSAGISLGLECIPLAEERYELVIPKEYATLRSIETLYDCIASTKYKTYLTTLGGYTTELTGAIREV
ncbi:MAG: molybdopterin biosynthesis protein [Desulfovibrionaceae bacterium]|nr:molybdopterin biosynthesis protein [Desulfovibrionaceae bacterium]